jgi:hypothetical protein
VDSAYSGFVQLAPEIEDNKLIYLYVSSYPQN